MENLESMGDQRPVFPTTPTTALDSLVNSVAVLCNVRSHPHHYRGLKASMFHTERVFHSVHKILEWQGKREQETFLTWADRGNLLLVDYRIAYDPWPPGPNPPLSRRLLY